jgi:hypothetical protein
VQGCEARGGLSSELVEEGPITQLCTNQAEAVKGREGLMNEMSAARCIMDLHTSMKRKCPAQPSVCLFLVAQLKSTIKQRVQVNRSYLQ